MSSHEKKPLLGRLVGEKSKDCTLEMSTLDPQMSLVEFSVGAQEEKIKCRRNTLKSSSPVFGSILTDLWNNGKNNEVIELPDVQPEHFKNFIKYVEEDASSFSSASFTVQQVEELFKIAKCYSASDLQEKCRQFLHSIRNISNAITIYQSAQFLNEAQLEYDTYTFITDHFAEILESKDFVNLSHSNLCAFLKLDEIIVCELNFFRAIFPINLLPFQVTQKKILSAEECHSLTQFIVDNERERGDISKIYPFHYKRRGIAPPKTYTVCFYDCLIYNSDMWQGKWNYNLIKVNCPIEVVSFGFDGPIQADAIYDVKIKLVIDDENSENVENEIVASKHEIVPAKKERTFYVKFENPHKLKPNVFYRACYALTGPKTICGVQPKNEVKMRCGDISNVVFTYKFVDGQVPEIRFTIPCHSS